MGRGFRVQRRQHREKAVVANGVAFGDNLLPEGPQDLVILGNQQIDPVRNDALIADLRTGGQFGSVRSPQIRADSSGLIMDKPFQFSANAVFQPDPDLFVPGHEIPNLRKRAGDAAAVLQPADPILQRRDRIAEHTAHPVLGAFFRFCRHQAITAHDHPNQRHRDDRK